MCFTLRQRRHRQRQQRRIKVYSVEVDDEGIARLIDAGWLEEREGLDGDCIANAIESLVEYVNEPMSAFPTISSALPPIADIIRVRQYVRS